MKKIIFLMCCFFFLGCSTSHEDKENLVQKIVIGGISFEIPAKYFLPDLPASMVPTKGLDKNYASALINIPLSDLGIIIKEKKSGLSDNIIVSIAKPDFKNPSVLDAWYGNNLYKKTIVEFDEEVKLYRVYPDVGSRFPSSWKYFKIVPDHAKDPFEYFIAGCISRANNRKSLISDGNAYCHAFLPYKNIESKLTIAGQNMLIREKITKKYLELLTSWDKTNEGKL